MKCKCWIGPIVCLIGIAVVLFAVHFMDRISSAKEDVGMMRKAMPKNGMSDHIGSSMQHHAGQYDSTVRHMLISGIVLICVGVGLAFILRKKSN